jgi:2-polyprenyl-3-methyl-5-hydroxy-6-metoxy-1,4-benzoquinol methylase
MSDDLSAVAAGQAVYDNRVLAIYDLFVLGLSNRWIWRCPTPLQLDHYNKNVSANHLDVGAGTGYFLDKCAFPIAAPRVALMDMNRNSLDFAALRIARYKPETYLRNVLEPIAFEGKKFDSIGVNYLLHCLPGSLEGKSAVFDHLKDLMTPGATLFGATLLQGGVERSWVARRLMAVYNRKRIFSNVNDDLASLERALQARFHSVSISVEGCGALFSAQT